MRRPVTTVDRVTALILFLAAFIALGAAQRTQGVMRDEAYYFKAAEEQWAWFEQFGDDKLRGDMTNKFNIARYWSYNNEHPPLFKTLSGLSWRIFHGYQPVGPGKDAVYHAQWKHPHEALSIMSEVSAFRLPAWFLTALCVAYGVWSVVLFVWKKRTPLELPQWILFAAITAAAGAGLFG